MASTSCSERALRLLEPDLPADEEILAIGEECPREFFRLAVEPLADSFDPAQSAHYERIMRAFLPPPPPRATLVPDDVETVYVLSRVTLGADIKIVAPVLNTMRGRFPGARVVLVGSRKSAELFARDRDIHHLEARYPSGGTVLERIEFGRPLGCALDTPNRIVVDPDSRMTQLGLVPVCEPDRYFHFPSRTFGGSTMANLSDLTERWLEETFEWSAAGVLRPESAPCDAPLPSVAVSLGVGGNDSKRIGGDFEARLLAELAGRYRSVVVDRGAGGEEAERVTAAVEASGAAGSVHYWEGSFAGFASIIGGSDLYVGYDSAGQHAAAAIGVPLISIFRGAPSKRFEARWRPAGRERIHVIDSDDPDPLRAVKRILAE